MKGKVFIAAPVHQVLTEGLQAAGYSLIYANEGTQEEAFELIGDCTGIIISTRLQLNKALLDVAAQLQWIGRMGSGMEVIDVAYATKKVIRCFSSPEGNCNAVAEHAVGMLLSLTKRIAWSAEEVKHGYWKREENRGTELEGKTIGIIGFGHTGQAFAKKLQGFDMNILVYDKNNSKVMPAYVTKCRDLQPLYDQADIVSFHVPLSADTIHYVNETFLLRMNQSFVLINTSRGEVIDTEVIKRGIETGKIRAAALDVWTEEPLERMGIRQREILDELVKLPQVIITPHIAGYTYEALYKMSATLLKKILIINH